MFSFYLVSTIVVFNHLNSLSVKKATGLDEIPSLFLKDGALILAEPLAHIINVSLLQGVVPDYLKSARVVTLYKKSDKTTIGNYPPVSILSVVSKIFERVVYDQVYSYFTNTKLFYEFQSGFRSIFSTYTCLILLTDFIRFEMDKCNMVGILLLDLQKAFGTVDLSSLLMKQEASGLGNDILF